MTPSLEYLFYVRSMTAKVCITSVCVFLSSLIMACMLSIKYFVFFTQILRFSLNWRTNLQNGVIFGILFYVRSITLRFVLHPFLFLSVLWLWLECYRSNTLSFLIKFIRISLNWSDTSPKCRLLWNFILLSQCLLGLYYIRLCFYKFLVYGLNVIYLIVTLFCWNFKNFHKLTDTFPKWRHLWNFICHRSMPLRFVLHPFVFL